MKTERFITQSDATTLSTLAEHLLRMRDVNLNFAETLLDLLATAILLPENVNRPDCVALYSKVTYRLTDTNDRSSIVIVSPQEANASLARVSILAPLAMALLGHPVGATVEAVLPGGKVQFLEVTDVAQGPTDGAVLADRGHQTAGNRAAL